MKRKDTFLRPGKSEAPEQSRNIILTATVLAVTALAGQAYGAPQGELDATFGDYGRVILSGPADFWGDAVAQQPADNKLLIAGSASLTTAGGHTGFAVLRLNPDGYPDDSFGDAGIVHIDFGGSYANASDLAVQADGKIIIVGAAEQLRRGDAEYASDYAVVRLNPNGTLDTSFGSSGQVLLDLGSDNGGFSHVGLMDDGRFVAAGVGDNGHLVFARYTADGALDPTFGTGTVPGVSVSALGGFWELKSMSVQADGRLSACTDSTLFFADNGWGPYPTGVAILKLDPVGAAEAGYGTNGVAQVTTGSMADYISTCVSLPDGSAIAAGVDNEEPFLMRLMPAGSLDPSFGTGGISRIDLGPGWGGGVQSARLLADGNLGLSGRIEKFVSDGSNPRYFFFARIDANSGVLDPDFGNNGLTIIDFGTLNLSSYAYNRELLQQSDGKLVAFGVAEYSGDIALARVDPAGAGSVGVAGFTKTATMFPKGAPSVTAEVWRTGGSTGTLSVDYDVVLRTTPTGHVAGGSGTVTWVSGDMAPKVIAVPVSNDQANLISILLSNSAGGLATSQFGAAFTAPVQTASRRGGGGAMGAGLLILLAVAAARIRRRLRPR